MRQRLASVVGGFLYGILLALPSAVPASAEPMGPLERAVERFISELRRRGDVASDERTAWSVYDFQTGEKLVSINEERPMQAASMIKPFIAAAFLAEVERGRLAYGVKSRRMLELMLQRSHNGATNWAMRQLGGPAATERLLRSRWPGIFKQTRLVEYIPAGGRTYRNKASARDYSRFLYAVWHEQFPRSRELKRLMALPNQDRIYTGAREVPEGTNVYHKTGSTRHLCGDMGILEVPAAGGKRYAYTLVGIIEKGSPTRNYSRWMRERGDVIREVSNLIYKEMERRGRFGELSVSSAR